MMRNFLLAVTTFLMLCIPASAKPLNLNQILEGTCRVGVPGAYGTGTVVAHNDGKFLILTNAHVVKNNKNATVEFFTRGNKTLPLRGEVIWKAHQERTHIDFAVIALSDASMTTWQPRVIPLAPRDFDLSKGQYITSAGCPGAAWPSAFEGSILRDIGSRILFTPPPIAGQSGSALFVQVPDSRGELHTRVGAVITWRIGQDGQDARGFDIATGGAIPMPTLYDAVEGKVAFSTTVPEDYKTIELLVDIAIGDDGKRYFVRVVDGKQEAKNLPKHVKIIRWPDMAQKVRSPANRGFPPINGYYDNYGYGNHYDIGGGRYGGGYVPNLGSGYADDAEEKENEKLEDKIEGLNDKYDNLKSDKDRADGLLAIKNGEINDLYSQMRDLEAKGGENKSRLEEFWSKITDLEKERDSLSITTNNAKAEASNVSFERNVYGGTTVLGVLSIIAMFFYKRRLRPIVVEKIDGIQDKVDDKIEGVVGEDITVTLRGIVEAMEARISSRIDARFGSGSQHGEAAKKEVKAAIFDHPDFVSPPNGPVYATPINTPVVGETKPQDDLEKVGGLGPVVPGYPARLHTAYEYQEAVDEVARRAQRNGDHALANVNVLVRQVLEAPRRPIGGE